MSYPVEVGLRETLWSPQAGTWRRPWVSPTISKSACASACAAGSAALRADEVARGPDTETFGTGLSTLANPELRARFRVIQRA